MKRWLLPEGLPFFKANLHSHSTVSDGKFTPAELKKAYMEKATPSLPLQTTRSWFPILSLHLMISCP